MGGRYAAGQRAGGGLEDGRIRSGNAPETADRSRAPAEPPPPPLADAPPNLKPPPPPAELAGAADAAPNLKPPPPPEAEVPPNLNPAELICPPAFFAAAAAPSWPGLSASHEMHTVAASSFFTKHAGHFHWPGCNWAFFTASAQPMLRAEEEGELRVCLSALLRADRAPWKSGWQSGSARGRTR
eukprot:SAG31_NODE_223_length_19859_cov_14.949899_13_plen_184_part_00